MRKTHGPSLQQAGRNAQRLNKIKRPPKPQALNVDIIKLDERKSDGGSLSKPAKKKRKKIQLGLPTTTRISDNILLKSGQIERVPSAESLTYEKLILDNPNTLPSTDLRLSDIPESRSAIKQRSNSSDQKRHMLEDRSIQSQFLRKWPIASPDTVPEVQEEDTSILLTKQFSSQNNLFVKSNLRNKAQAPPNQYRSQMIVYDRKIAKQQEAEQELTKQHYVKAKPPVFHNHFVTQKQRAAKQQQKEEAKEAKLRQKQKRSLSFQMLKKPVQTSQRETIYQKDVQKNEP